MQKKKKNKLFIFLIICFVLMPFLFTKGCNYMESLNQAENSISEPISSASAYSHIHERAHNAQMHSIRKANWSGTAVPSSGYVENVYFNTNLSVNEVVSIIDSANLTYDSEGSYSLCADFSNGSSLAIFDTSSSFGVEGYAILCGLTGFGWVFVSNEDLKNILSDFGVNNVGWQSSFDGLIENNGNVRDGGNENDKLSSLISITPFEQSSNNELSISNLFTQLGNAMIIFGSAVVNLFISMEPIFWNNGPTLIFILLIAAVSFALVFWGIELLISLINVFKTKRKKKK